MAHASLDDLKNAGMAVEVWVNSGMVEVVRVLGTYLGSSQPFSFLIKAHEGY